MAIAVALVPQGMLSMISVGRMVRVVVGRGVSGIVMAMLIGLIGWIAPAWATGVYDFSTPPATESWVIDEADILSRATEGKLASQFSDVLAKSGTHVRVVTIHRLDYGETIDSFTNALFERWFPDREAQDNQALLVLDNVTNTSAIRVGDGVKETLTDEIARSVAQETLLVPLRKGDKYNQAFSDVGDRLLAVLSGQPDPGPPAVEMAVQTEGTFATPEETRSSNATLWVIGLLVAATVIPMATYYLYQVLQS